MSENLAIVNPKGEAYHPCGCGCPKSGHHKGCEHYLRRVDKVAHEASNPVSDLFANWAERLQGENEALYCDRWDLVAKSRAMARNNPNLQGAINYKADAIVGPHFRCKPTINYRALGWSRDEAFEVEQQIRHTLRDHYYGKEKLGDARRTRTLTQAAASQLCTEMVSGDWMVEFGESDMPDQQLRTVFQLVDPMRVFTPTGRKFEQNKNIYHGILRNRQGMPVAYYVHNVLHGRRGNDRDGGRVHRHTGFDRTTQDYRRVPRYSDNGRVVFGHGFDTRIDAEAIRGRPMATASLVALKGSDKLQQSTLQASIVQSLMVAVITSSMPDFKDMLGGMPNDQDPHPASKYMNEAKEWLGETGITMDGMHVPRLFPHEKLDLTAPHQPFSDFDTFQQTFHAMQARGLGMGFSQYTGMFNRMSYSAARAEMLIAWRDLNSRREHCCADFASLVHCNTLQEAFEEGLILYPPRLRAQLFNRRARQQYWMENRSALSGCRWYGPAREEVDPVKGAMTAEINARNGWLTDSDKLIQDGKDFVEQCEELEWELRQKLRLAQLREEIAGIENRLGDQTGASSSAVRQTMDKLITHALTSAPDDE